MPVCLRIATWFDFSAENSLTRNIFSRLVGKTLLSVLWEKFSRRRRENKKSAVWRQLKWKKNRACMHVEFNSDTEKSYSPKILPPSSPSKLCPHFVFLLLLLHFYCFLRSKLCTFFHFDLHTHFAFAQKHSTAEKRVRDSSSSSSSFNSLEHRFISPLGERGRERRRVKTFWAAQTTVAQDAKGEGRRETFQTGASLFLFQHHSHYWRRRNSGIMPHVRFPPYPHYTTRTNAPSLLPSFYRRRRPPAVARKHGLK